MQCSPYNNDKFFKGHNTCFSKKQLLTISKKLKLSKSSSQLKHMSKQDIWNAINEFMVKRHGCPTKNEHCWLKYYPHFENASHVPQHPLSWFDDPDAWLSNLDILNVMVQFEQKYTTFKFIGVFPIDFASVYGFGKCVSEEICDLNISSLKKKYNSFGAVFNLDKHYEPGSHWVAIYFNVDKTHKNYGFYYFDSNATPPPYEIIKFYKSIKSKLKSNTFQIQHNTVQKQFENSECGMFCIYFLTLCLQNISFEKIMKTPFDDHKVFALRKKYFRKPF